MIVTIDVHDMATCSLMCVVILFALVVTVLSQFYPRFEFSGTVLTNNSYIRLSHIGIGPNSSLHCVTDYLGCCNNREGNWYKSKGSLVQQGTTGNSGLYVTIKRNWSCVSKSHIWRNFRNVEMLYT